MIRAEYVPLCLQVICFCMIPLSADLYGQCGQECDFFLVWTVMCRFMYLLWSDTCVHNLHLYITPSISMWESRHLVVPTGSLQRGHGSLSSSSSSNKLFESAQWTFTTAWNAPSNEQFHVGSHMVFDSSTIYNLQEHVLLAEYLFISCGSQLQYSWSHLSHAFYCVLSSLRIE